MPQVFELDIHGTVDKYKRGSCRCAPCTAAWNKWMPCGTVHKYQNHKCRCDLCKGAKRAYDEARFGITITPKPPAVEWSMEIIHDAVISFRARYGRMPGDRDTFALPVGQRWSVVRTWLGRRGYTLSGTLQDRSRQGFEWSLAVILAAAEASEAETGWWPRRELAKRCEAFGGRSWKSADAWLRAELGLSLARLRSEGSTGHRSMMSAGMEASL